MDRTAMIRIDRDRGGPTEFTIAVDDFTTILDALEQIRGEHEPGLLFRHSCHHGSCGTCGLMANGQRVLGCTTRVVDLDSPVELRPLSPFPVIGDLAIDPVPMYEEFPQDATLLRRSESKPDSVPPSEIREFTRFENCIECGLCESACPVRSGSISLRPSRDDAGDHNSPREFKGPAALAAYSREIEKRPDRAEQLIAEIDQPAGVWACDRELQCSLVCPVEVYPARHIAILQRRIGARNAPV